MPFCGNCGNRVSDLAIACPKCGTMTPHGEAQDHTPKLARAYEHAPDLRPLGVGEIIDAAIKVYKNNASTLLTLTAVVVVPVQIVSALIIASGLPDFDQSTAIRTTPGATAPNVDFGALRTAIAAVLVSSLLNIVAAQLATAASLRTVSEAYLGERPDWRESLSFALRRFAPVLGAAFLITILSGLAFLACVIPGIWLSIAWSVAIPALLFEGIGPTKAMSRSFGLVRGRWWSVFGVYVLSQLIAGVLRFIVGGIFGVVLRAGSSATLTVFLRNAIVGSIAGVLITPFIAATIAIIYFDLRVRKEGFDLELLAQRFGGSAPTVPPLPPAPPPQPRPRPRAPGHTPDGEPPKRRPRAPGPYAQAVEEEPYRPPESDDTEPKSAFFEDEVSDVEDEVSDTDDDDAPAAPAKPAARKPAARKPAAKKPAAPKPAAKRPAPRKAAPRASDAPDDEPQPPEGPDEDPEFFHG